MTRFHIFIIRAILGAAFAVIMTRLYFGKINLMYVVGLSIFMVGMAYVLEYFRNR